MIHWYRATVRHRPIPPADPCIRVPTLLIWGPGDLFVSRELAEASLALCDEGRLEWVEGATHWPHHEKPGWGNRLLLDFLSGLAPPLSQAPGWLPEGRPLRRFVPSRRRRDRA